MKRKVQDLICKIRVSGLFLVGLIFFLMITNVFAETREFIFTVTDGEIELNGTRFMVWKYNDMFPGPR